MSFSKRAQTIDEFRDPDGPDVLLMSQVGSTGLNLDFANVLIVMVSSLHFNPSTANRL